MEPVQQEGQQFLTVVLLVAQELRRKVTHLRLRRHKHSKVQVRKQRPSAGGLSSGGLSAGGLSALRFRQVYLEDPWHHRVVAPGPHLLDDIGVRLGDLPLHPQWVGEVQLLQVGAPQEVLSERRSVAQTLQR